MYQCSLFCFLQIEESLYNPITVIRIIIQVTQLSECKINIQRGADMNI